MEGQLGFCSAVWRRSGRRRTERLGDPVGTVGEIPVAASAGGSAGRLRDPSRDCCRLRLEHDPCGDPTRFDVSDRLVDVVEWSCFADHACLAGGVKLEYLA